MDPIPAWLKRLWDLWDVRILVLLSLTLQVILTIFGNRRRYISSLWLNIVVWSAYLTADWVATVALGKLSDAQSDDHNTNNAVRAIWAPMLLLHLGGPDTITAYSLEDNQLWMRHLLGLAVQVIVAVYVILVSWKNSWFSFLSFPALVAGIIRYGERTWVLKSVCNDKSGDIVPIGNQVVNPDNIGLEEKDVRNLVLAKEFTKGFMAFMDQYDLSPRPYIENAVSPEFYIMNLPWDAMEVGIRLMYDILYTKAAVNYSRVGCILRCVSVTCTMSVFVGIFWLLPVKEDYKLRHDYYSSKVDIGITVSLLVGALALEIYATTMLISSEWAMFWLVKHKREKWVIQLWQRFSWLFKKKKTWSKTMGQFDLLGFIVKDAELERRLSTRIVGRLLGTGLKDKFKRYMHNTSVSVPSYLRDRISDDSYLWRVETGTSIREENELWTMFPFRTNFRDKVFFGHVITETCYHLETEWLANQTESSKQNKVTCRVLSNYVMYLRFTCPSLLPDSVQRDALWEGYIDEVKVVIGETRDAINAISTCRLLYERYQWPWFKNIINYLKEKQGVERWELLSCMWLRLLFYAAGKGDKNEHLQRLRQGGEFLTSLWFSIPQSRNHRGVFFAARDIHEIRPAMNV